MPAKAAGTWYMLVGGTTLDKKLVGWIPAIDRFVEMYFEVPFHRIPVCFGIAFFQCFYKHAMGYIIFRQFTLF